MRIDPELHATVGEEAGVHFTAAGGHRLATFQQNAAVPEDLPTMYRDLAALHQGYSAPAELVWKQAAELAERAVDGWRWEKLPLTAAEVESGYTQAHLRRLIAEGKVPGAGIPGKPRFTERQGHMSLSSRSIHHDLGGIG